MFHLVAAFVLISSLGMTGNQAHALRNKCSSLVDIILVIQYGGLTQTTFQQDLSFVANLTKGFKLGPSDTRVGAITYGTNPRKLFDLYQYNDTQDLSQAIMSSSFFTDDNINTAEALRYITRQGMFNTALGGRPHLNATQIIIVLTSGQSHDPNQTYQAAKEQKDKGVKIMVIGTSSANTDELLLLASDPSKVFHARSYEVMENIRDIIANKICKKIRKPLGISYEEMSCEKPVVQSGEYFKGLLVELIPYEPDCSSFTAVIKCPKELVYDREKKLCRDRELVDNCNDITSTASPTTSTTKKVISAPQCMNGWDFNDGSCYGVGVKAMSWVDASRFCELYGGYLVKITSKLESDYVKSLAINKNLRIVWLGGTDLVSERHWIWASRELGVSAFGFQDWTSGQPDNGGGRGQNCLTMSHNYNWKWDDDFCDLKCAFVCEAEPITG